MANGLVTTAQFPGLVPDIGRLATGFAQGQQITQRQQQLTAGQQQLEAQRKRDRIRSIITGAAQVQAIPSKEGKVSFLRNRIRDLERQGLPTDDTREALNLFEAGRVDEANQLIDRAVQLGERLGIIQPIGTTAQRFEPVRDEKGNIIAQRNIATGQVVSDPRAEAIRKREKVGIEAELEATEDQFERSQKLRKELSTSSSEFRKVEAAFERIKATNVGTPAGDLALIFNFMKMLDPGSVVRESEFSTAADAKAWLGRKDQEGIPVPNQVRQIIQRATEGTILLAEQRKDFSDRAKDLFEGAEKLQKKDEKKILSIAKQFNVPKSLILGEEPLTEEEQAELEELRRRKQAGEI